MKIYTHKVLYHETDKMGITHHSNYIRWMEEARMDLFEQIGFPFSSLEKCGAVSPVVSVECEYKTPTRFDDLVDIKVSVEEFKGVRLILRYIMQNSRTGDTVSVARSSHCFVDKDNKPIALKKSFPDFDKALKNLTSSSSNLK